MEFCNITVQVTASRERSIRSISPTDPLPNFDSGKGAAPVPFSDIRNADIFFHVSDISAKLQRALHREKYQSQ